MSNMKYCFPQTCVEIIRQQHDTHSERIVFFLTFHFQMHKWAIISLHSQWIRKNKYNITAFAAAAAVVVVVTANYWNPIHLFLFDLYNRNSSVCISSAFCQTICFIFLFVVVFHFVCYLFLRVCKCIFRSLNLIQ